MALKVEKVPLHWDSKGRILKWARSSQPVKNVEGKQAFQWCEATERVLLWIYTYPPNNWERIQEDKMTAKQKEFYRHSSPEVEAKRRQFSFGKIAKRDENHYIISFVDDLRAGEASIRNKPSPWGDPPQDHTLRDRQSLRTFVKHKKWMLRFIGGILYKWIEDRDSDALEELAKTLKGARGLSLTWHSKNGIWHHADTFQGTVYRCWQVLWSWSIHKDWLPTKRGLRDYVIQEWEAMGNSAVTVETEFSGALKVLGLSKLPNSPRMKAVVPRTKRRDFEK
jgi:hypothetical protein